MSDRGSQIRVPHDLDIHCPRLGGTVPFRYCLAPGEPNPCFKILDCWWETFDITSYLRNQLPESGFNEMLRGRTPPNRLAVILDSVERLKKE
jgi:hypothetical protein